MATVMKEALLHEAEGIEKSSEDSPASWALLGQTAKYAEAKEKVSLLRPSRTLPTVARFCAATVLRRKGKSHGIERALQRQSYVPLLRSQWNCGLVGMGSAVRLQRHGPHP